MEFYKGLLELLVAMLDLSASNTEIHRTKWYLLFILGFTTIGEFNRTCRFRLYFFFSLIERCSKIRGLDINIVSRHMAGNG
jgi:hypothetical protein